MMPSKEEALRTTSVLRIKKPNKKTLRYPEFSNLGSCYHFRLKGCWSHGKYPPLNRAVVLKEYSLE